jgi:anti-sigma B factor antagonist
MTKLNITERRNDDVLILDLEGNVTLGEGCVELRKALRLFVENGERKVLLNLAKVSYIDSSGLGELVASYTNFKKNEGEVKLVHLTQKVHELMVLTKLLTIFDSYETELAAVESFNNPKVKTAQASRLV